MKVADYDKTVDEQTLEELRSRLAEAEETIRAIRQGEVDALVVSDAAGDRVYTLRGADAPYRALVEQMPDGAATLTVTGDILYCNRALAELVGWPLEHIVGSKVEHFLDPADRDALCTLITRGVGRLRSKLYHGGQLSTDVYVSIGSVTLDGVAHRTLVLTDLTVLTRAQRESQSKDEFLAMLAHELRNPLGAIAGAIQLLTVTGPGDPAGLSARDVIHRQVRHMAKLVDDLLDVARVMTGKIALDLEDVDLAESVRTSVATIVAGQPTPVHVEVSTEPVWVRADSVRLEQVVGNLLSNALKFTQSDARVSVTVGPEGSDAVLRVVDQGHGIPEDLLPHIFDLFVQASDTTDRPRGGLGIGLTLVRRLVELHGGAIDVSSAGPGKGATFIVRLPAISSHATVSASAVPFTPGPRRRVLLVDDNADVREMYRLVLQADGHHVQVASDGDGALALFQAATPDVAIIDIGLPGMDGYELARRLRAQPEGSRLTLIALTGYGFPAHREQSRAAGFDRHLVKPLAPDLLRRELS